MFSWASDLILHYRIKSYKHNVEHGTRSQAYTELFNIVKLSSRQTNKPTEKREKLNHWRVSWRMDRISLQWNLPQAKYLEKKWDSCWLERKQSGSRMHNTKHCTPNWKMIVRMNYDIVVENLNEIGNCLKWFIDR